VGQGVQNVLGRARAVRAAVAPAKTGTGKWWFASQIAALPLLPLTKEERAELLEVRGRLEVAACLWPRRTSLTEGY